MKHPRHGVYPADITALSERVLLTAWPALADYHDDLVLLGGLVPRYLCRPQPPTFAAVTMDVDLGIALAANVGQYGSLSSHLAGIGFKRVDQRFVKRVRDRVDIYLDFLTEAPGRSSGTVMVDDVPTSVFLGIDRALAINRRCTVAGTDLFGAAVRCQIRVCEAGPFVVLKLIAFAGRGQPKDAFDLHQIALHYDGDVAAVIAGFAAERDANSGFVRARAVLEQHFVDIESSGPLRGASFVYGETPDPNTAEAHLQFRRELVSFAQALLAAS